MRPALGCALLALVLLAHGQAPDPLPRLAAHAPPGPEAEANPAPPVYLPSLRQGLVYTGSVTFAVIGDYGVCAAGSPETCRAGRRVAEMMQGWRPDFVLTTGDNNYPYGAEDTFWANLAPYADYIPGRFEPAAGNHEYMCPTCPEPFIRLFQRPLTRQIARPSRDNPLLRVFIVDSNPADDGEEGPSGPAEKAAMLNPLGAQRQAAARLPACWRIVAMHHPPYASGGRYGHHPELTTSAGWRYRDWGVDVVLAGHEHNYERLVRSVTYIITGTGGGELDEKPKGTPVPGSVSQVYGAYGAVRGYADASRLELAFVTTDPSDEAPNEAVRDVHVLRRNCAASP